MHSQLAVNLSHCFIGVFHPEKISNAYITIDTNLLNALLRKYLYTKITVHFCNYIRLQLKAWEILS